ncbi:unnamed protein product [Adineta ricciae]|uniref:Uncharacterized protein n=1 Tax=Adineta ricciae TaxID=249248 RepID=A0A814ZCT0_ADIRI|nr:unnamed protein product [Adineta ricciae]CAF1527534.1 unnamed protein product [Adineta ricciae]
MYFGVPWRKIDLFLKDIGGLSAQSCNKWSRILIEEDLEEFLEDNRGGKHSESFFDIYPELESLAKLYAIKACKRKAASFTCTELAEYLDDQYYKVTGEVKNTQQLIRSEKTCHLDLHRWGCKFDKNTAKPYWEGHERPDVVEARTKFVRNFLTNQDKYYRVEEGKDPQWNTPKKNPTVLIFHDESCFRSGETAAKRWFYSDDTTTFFNKGRGRSLMVSDFLIAHPDNPFFQLSQDEWKAAVKKYPELLEDDGIQYIERSASGSIQVGFGGYFDNDAIINQFTRLFKMLPFKQAYANHKFHVIVDNARTHSAKHYSVEDFGMKPGTRCKTDKIFYRDEDGQKQSIDCFFTTGSNKGQSKGLLILAKELGIKTSSNIRLEELKRLLNSHDAFKNISKLEMVANDYGVAVTFSPKFHCELNPIEGLWAHQKQFVRHRTDQTFPTMLKLIQKSRTNFIEKNVSLKLIRRFWRTLAAYDRGESYEDVLKMYFSSMCKANVVSHRQITNSNLND